MRAEVHSPTYLGGVWDHTGAGILDPGKLAARPARRGAARRRARLRALAPCTTSATDRSRVAHRRQGRVRAPRKVLLATSAYPPLLQRDPPLRRAGLRLRAGHRAAERRAARRDRLGAPPGHRRRRQPVPLLPPDRRRPHPVRRLGRRLPLPRPGRPAPRRARRRRSRRSPSTSSTRSRSSRACASPTAGAARSTPPRASRSSSAPRSAAASPTPPATPASASAPPASAAAPPLDLLDGRDTEATRLRYVRSKPVPFPPEPLRSPSSSSPATGSRPPTATTAAAASGCVRSTASGLGFDS